MNWNNHLEIEGKHAFLSASQYHWLNYTPDKLVNVYKNNMAKEEGIWLHNFAAMAIQKKLKMSRSKNTLNLFVNDAIGFNMTAEQMLYYSNNSFGTADAIAFKGGTLRIHDYKTGGIKASMKQLDIYAALFCLEYGIDPLSINTIQRIYQFNTFIEAIPDPNYIAHIMSTIVEFDDILEVAKREL